MYKDLTFLQKLAADWGRPNDNGGSNYTDPELRYYMRDILKGYNDFIPTPVLRDAWKGANAYYAQPMANGSRYTYNGELWDILKNAINTRVENRNAKDWETSPTGANYNEMWNAPLSPSDEIIRQLYLGNQLGSSKEDYYPPMNIKGR